MDNAEKNGRTNLLIIQPYLTAYRLPVFTELAEDWDVTIVSSVPQGESGYGTPDITGSGIREHILVPEYQIFGGRLLWQSRLIRILWHTRPDKILCAANPRNLGFWCVMLLSRMIGVQFYSWGQGMYNKLIPPRWLRYTYRILIAFSTRYICYTPSVANSLPGLLPASKLAVVNNSIVSLEPVLPEEKTGQETGILFIGRLREGNNLSLLIDVIEQFRSQGPEFDLTLHVIGSGEELPGLMNRFGSLSWIVWYGQIYDQGEINKISRLCSIGCYPGDAGLSVVHYMALSLIPIVHDRADRHMGPEPSYVVDGVNGYTFNYSNPVSSLLEVFIDVFGSNNRKNLMMNAWKTYMELTSPSLAKRMKIAMSQDE
ncbi:MAG: glycosyltransferase [Methylococcales bacterium]|nr:glycosyltransferase [Methylococcales bacterium]